MAWTPFSDWGADPAYEDIDDAQEQLAEWMASAVSSNGWPSDVGAAIVAGGLATKESMETFFGYDTGTALEYWKVIARDAWLWAESTGTDTTELDNWDKWQDVFDGAAETAETTEESRELGTVDAVVGGAIEETLSDLAPGLELAKNAAYGAALGGALGFGGMFLIDKKQALMGLYGGLALGALGGAALGWPSEEA